MTPDPLAEITSRVFATHTQEIRDAMFARGFLEMDAPPPGAFWVPAGRLRTEPQPVTGGPRWYPQETDTSSRMVRVVDPRAWGEAWLYFGVEE